MTRALVIIDIQNDYFPGGKMEGGITWVVVFLGERLRDRPPQLGR
jgi:nicotinamidase-related amidase